MLEFGAPNVKDEILHLLAEKPHLEAKKIHTAISRQLPVTYQAVHKALQDLVKQKIVQKDATGRHSLNPLWLRHVKQFVDTALPNVDSNVVVDQTFVELDSLSAVDDFLIHASNRLFKKGRTLCANWSHFWIPLFEKQSTYAAMKRLIINSEGYSITPSDTPVDRWCADYWKKHDIHIKTGVGFTGIDFVTYADHVIQVFYPRDIRKQLDEHYNKAKTIRQLDMDGLYENVFRKKTKIPVLVLHNPKLAKHLENEIKAEFAKRK